MKPSFITAVVLTCLSLIIGHLILQDRKKSVDDFISSLESANNKHIELLKSIKAETQSDELAKVKKIADISEVVPELRMKSGSRSFDETILFRVTIPIATFATSFILGLIIYRFRKKTAL